MLMPHFRVSGPWKSDTGIVLPLHHLYEGTRTGWTPALVCNFLNKGTSLQFVKQKDPAARSAGQRKIESFSLSRRQMLVTSAFGLVATATHTAVAAPAISPELLRQAREALDRHSAQILNRDLIAVADFSLPSCLPRFHLVDLARGRVTSHLVAHGRGSDPRHTGWLERFSNAPGSHATSAGAYRTDGFYTGGHGHSIRLSGLDPSNDNALSRAIVVHGAWYVSEGMAASHGVLGRSEGCFAVSAASLNAIVGSMGPGHLIYAGKVGDHPAGLPPTS